MKAEHHPRAPRHPFAARIEIIDIETGARLVAQTRNLNLNGCFIATSSSLPVGSKIRAIVSRGGEVVAALCKVAYSGTEGMGIGFMKIEPGGEATLDKWIGRLRE